MWFNDLYESLVLSMTCLILYVSCERLKFLISDGLTFDFVSLELWMMLNLWL